MADPLLVYGATGYTGRLIVAEAVRAGLRPIVCGRNARELAALADAHGLSYRVARLEQPAELDRVLADTCAVLHAAGPFVETAAPMVAACLRVGAHYLDITGEMPVLEAVARRGTEARQRRLMLLPGVGFDVVPSDCLAAHVARRLPGAERLLLAIKGLALSTRGSARTLVRHAGLDQTVRWNGQLARIAAGALERDFDFGSGPERCLNVGWGDVVTAFYTTGIPNIEVYFDAVPIRDLLIMASRHFGWLLQTPPWQAWLMAWTEVLPEGPSSAQRADAEMVLIAEAHAPGGQIVRSRLRTPEAYQFTAAAAVAVARRVIAGDVEWGFQTPGRVYGPDFVLSLPHVTRVDLP